MLLQKRFFYAVIPLGMAILIANCSPNAHKGLRKLSYEQQYTRALQVNIPPGNVVFQDEKGQVIQPEALNQLNPNAFAADQYVDKSDTVRLYVIRKIKPEDIQLRQRIGQLYEDSIELQILRIQRTEKDSARQKRMIELVKANGPIKPVKINCDSVGPMLEKVLELDQKSRESGGIDLNIDRQNQITVVSIFEGCGVPDASVVGKGSIYSMFMVIQHASRKLREKYLPVFKAQSEKGFLDKATLALMEDRLLMDQGKKQIYGTQVRSIGAASNYELYELEDPANVDKRRAAIGLGPIKAYLEHFGVDWEAYLKNLKH